MITFFLHASRRATVSAIRRLAEMRRRRAHRQLLSTLDERTLRDIGYPGGDLELRFEPRR